VRAPEATLEWDAERAAGLRSARFRATGLLVVVAVLFALAHLLTDGTGWWGYAQAAAEAGLVGGFADWFAVTALFRHPLGIPIPHTAIIRNRKTEFGVSLGEFVARNFLDPDLVEARLGEADPAARLGLWLADPTNAATAAHQAAGVIVGVAEALQDREIQDGIREAVEGQVRRLDVASLGARGIQYSMEGGHYEALVDSGLKAVAVMVHENREMLRNKVRTESPWWMPDETVFRTIYAGLQRFVTDLIDNPQHDARLQINRKVQQFADRLESDQQLRARVDELKTDLLDHPEFRAWTDGLWADVKVSLTEAAEEPESELRLRLQSWVEALGKRLGSDPSLRYRINTWIGSVVSQVLRHSGEEVTRTIAATVERWDANETSDRLEMLLGRDLQYIRINGTLVGALIGVIIHTLVVVL
jgi:uncharacterized membrane-anchored protein YjiN (DUF445 family)